MVRIVTVARKPCVSGSTTANVVEHHAGAINVDACRIGQGDGGSREGEATRETRYADRGSTNFAPTPGPRGGDARGRWPANLVLQHREGCTRSGTTTVAGYKINRFTDGAKPFGGGAGHEYESEDQPDETVVVWDCEPGCPVAALDAVQTSVTGARSTSSQRARVADTNWYVEDHRSREYPNEVGTASRFFKQFQDEGAGRVSRGLTDYLALMIAPPSSCGPKVIVNLELDAAALEEHEDASVHGMITMGDPSSHMGEIDRVLRPGAHLLVVASEDEPTGHTGACAVEDFGYEIRDAVVVVDVVDEFSYVAKPSRSERNAGVSPSAGPGGREVFNTHPTVKPVRIMENLLSDVPENGTVVDPFVGSGTTGIACLRTGHSFVGIDQSEQYLHHAEERLRHHDRAQNAWGSTVIIESDVASETPPEALSVEDLFGL